MSEARDNGRDRDRRASDAQRVAELEKRVDGVARKVGNLERNVEVAPGPTTHTVTYTTSSLANNASETAVLNLGVGFTILKFTSNFAARFRAYQAVSYRTADSSRAVGVRPSADHGLIFEEDGASATAYGTAVVGGLLGGETLCPISITNRSGATRAITITIEVRS